MIILLLPQYLISPRVYITVKFIVLTIRLYYLEYVNMFINIIMSTLSIYGQNTV
jgi:hypothetical protein